MRTSCAKECFVGDGEDIKVGAAGGPEFTPRGESSIRENYWRGVFRRWRVSKRRDAANDEAGKRTSLIRRSATNLFFLREIEYAGECGEINAICT